jgi:hypothetical protein
MAALVAFAVFETGCPSWYREGRVKYLISENFGLFVETWAA